LAGWAAQERFKSPDGPGAIGCGVCQQDEWFGFSFEARMVELLSFLGDLVWGVVGLFRKSTARRSRQYQGIGVALLAGWLAAWAAAVFGPEGWRPVLFVGGAVLMAAAMFCGYMRLGGREPQGKRRRGA
jgi:hypothetical protein